MLEVEGGAEAADGMLLNEAGFQKGVEADDATDDVASEDAEELVLAMVTVGYAPAPVATTAPAAPLAPTVEDGTDTFAGERAT